MRYKGKVTATRVGLEINAGDETIPIMVVVDVGFYYEGSVQFTCQLADAPKVGDVYTVDIERVT